jgi:predicted dehydrogenase
LIRLAILGVDSSHAELFGRLVLDRKDVLGNDVSISAVWGECDAEALRLATALHLDAPARTPESALQRADGALVLGRFADAHRVPACLAIERGVPTFIDKPVADSVGVIREFSALADKHKCLVTGGSALRWCSEVGRATNALASGDARLISVRGPAHCTDLGDDPRFESVFFYGVHAVEMLLQTLGHRIEDVTIEKRPDGIHARCRTARGRGQIDLLRRTPEFYEIGAYGPRVAGASVVALDGTYNLEMLRRFVSAVRGNEAPVSLDSTLAATHLLAQIHEVGLTHKGRDD